MGFGRVITAMVTPFDENLQVNWDQIEPLVDYLIEEQHSDGLVICGTTGESPTLTKEEKLKLIELAVTFAKGRCKIIAGTGSNSTQHTIHFSQKVQHLGVDALLIVAPYYNRPSQEGLYQHFKAVAESVEVPIFLYNVPSRTGVNIDADTTIRLSKIPNIIGTKDCGNTDQLTQILTNAKKGFLVYSGDDSMTLPAVAVGCQGIVSVASHLVGKEMQDMISYYVQGDIRQAVKLQSKLLPIFKGLFQAPSPAPVKFALNDRDMKVGGVRLPLVNVTEEEGQYIRTLFK
ncbi:dihydrodipicolinate synthase DapA [Paenibacillus larvae subsp. larvae]|uniref:4-hydroxy-tetrahydrodipicolinate synthase n=1 Tax=Paenibacillus larvae subsp. larvae TaxID=147375 RepID=A0A2L1UFA0_9BACL|nr:4-hydroxy-tetrahydrodipicolinate synthase [Paenibacillus larvae]AQT83613.1 4-hydroxy-tetrahydrodipicolinate synthase [Paenibacillus larvae subsp. pulvifaciens]AQZ48730.1 4-hydroxy-tetrahydrodipicolinate synthase [Paenibacillus larvae subsp. pulvifaciens]AVF26820.1 dihydrodipicolinate synthase DapA [Paenibacillus larvae subsp. larvae]AVF31571.1 dihydrodipicolinate synthase DapA [Paenibacillus larvae subsp. larvae]MBH0342534.1 dihydrodipicolinate synthase [Paenibacillus larvae]